MIDRISCSILELVVIMHFNPVFIEMLPETHALLAPADLRVHDAVERVTLHGSRGPKGGARPDSDVDLCLVVDSRIPAEASDREGLLREVLDTTLGAWRGKVELDLAAAFDKSECGLRCLLDADFDLKACSQTVDCMGVFKTQRGFNGFVSGPAVDCSKMLPLMVVWSREGIARQ